MDDPSAGQILDDLLRRAGAKFNRVRLGPGVVGNTSTVLVIALPSCAATAWALSPHPDVALIAVFVELLLLGGYLWGTWSYARRYPEYALLGGSDLIKALEMQMAAKGYPSVPTMPAEGPPPIDVDVPEKTTDAP